MALSQNQVLIIGDLVASQVVDGHCSCVGAFEERLRGAVAVVFPSERLVLDAW